MKSAGINKGWPMVAHIAALLALAIAACFAVNFAILTFLPPRPPDVVRADRVISAFTKGYRALAAGEKPAELEGARWSVAATAPRAPNRDESPPARAIRRGVAGALNLPAQSVRLAFDAAGRDAMVFRVNHQDLRVIARTEARAIVDGKEQRTITIVTPGGVTVTREGPPIPAPPIPPVPDIPPIPMPPPAPDVLVLSQDVLKDLPQAVRERLQKETAIAAHEAPIFAPAPRGVVLMQRFMFAAQLPDGRWAMLRQHTTADEYGWLMRAGLIAGLSLLVVLGLALLFARQFARPMQLFAEAAERVGVDPAGAAVAETGPAELRSAARSINTMQARLRALVAERTQMLASVAHDLRTPLMRLRLAADTADPALRQKLAKEAGEIDALIAAFIAFAREDPAQEARVRLDLGALLHSIVDDRVGLGQDVRFDGPDKLVMTGQPVGLKRLIENGVENAVKYGESAHVRLHEDAAFIIIDIADKGPGVAIDKREAAFQPFERLGEQRAIGAGLGLASARSIARAHGGDCVILDAPGGGCLLRTTLPKAD
jgi:signal transduction histidine kinase